MFFIALTTVRHSAIQRQIQQYHRVRLARRFNSRMPYPALNTISGCTIQITRIQMCCRGRWQLQQVSISCKLGCCIWFVWPKNLKMNFQLNFYFGKNVVKISKITTTFWYIKEISIFSSGQRKIFILIFFYTYSSLLYLIIWTTYENYQTYFISVEPLKNSDGAPTLEDVQ